MARLCPGGHDGCDGGLDRQWLASGSNSRDLSTPALDRQSSYAGPRGCDRARANSVRWTQCSVSRGGGTGLHWRRCLEGFNPGSHCATRCHDRDRVLRQPGSFCSNRRSQRHTGHLDNRHRARPQHPSISRCSACWSERRDLGEHTDQPSRLRGARCAPRRPSASESGNALGLARSERRTRAHRSII